MARLRVIRSLMERGSGASIRPASDIRTRVHSFTTCSLGLDLIIGHYGIGPLAIRTLRWTWTATGRIPTSPNSVQEM